jgi:hypothetical protein
LICEYQLSSKGRRKREEGRGKREKGRSLINDFSTNGLGLIY